MDKKAYLKLGNEMQLERIKDRIDVIENRIDRIAHVGCSQYEEAAITDALLSSDIGWLLKMVRHYVEQEEGCQCSTCKKVRERMNVEEKIK